MSALSTGGETNPGDGSALARQRTAVDQIGCVMATCVVDEAAAMAIEPDEDERRALKRFTRGNLLRGLTLFVPSTLVLLYFAAPYVERRFGVEHYLAQNGLLLIYVILVMLVAKARTWLGYEPRRLPTPRLRMLAEQRSRRANARSRSLLIFATGVFFLTHLGTFIVGNQDAGLRINDGWILALIGVGPITSTQTKSAVPEDGPARTDVLEAFRLGFGTTMVLGFAAVLWDAYHPGTASGALPVVLLGGLLATLVRLAVLDRQAARRTRPPDLEAAT